MIYTLCAPILYPINTLDKIFFQTRIKNRTLAEISLATTTIATAFLASSAYYHAKRGQTYLFTILAFGSFAGALAAHLLRKDIDAKADFEVKELQKAIQKYQQQLTSNIQQNNQLEKDLHTLMQTEQTLTSKLQKLQQEVQNQTSEHQQLTEQETIRLKTLQDLTKDFQDTLPNAQTLLKRAEILEEQNAQELNALNQRISDLPSHHQQTLQNLNAGA